MQTMADRFRGHERRFSDAGACSHPSAESFIGRLDELDIRLRQLEEKQSLPESYFAADLRRAAARSGPRQQCKSLSSALHDVRLKGTLMDRLHLLETRIRELSSELDKGGSNAGSWNENGPSPDIPLEKKKKKKQGHALSSSRAVGGPWRAGDMFQAHKSKPKDPKKEAMEAMEKRASAMCRNEKRRMERARIYKRWFPVGC